MWGCRQDLWIRELIFAMGMSLRFSFCFGLIGGFCSGVGFLDVVDEICFV